MNKKKDKDADSKSPHLVSSGWSFTETIMSLPLSSPTNRWVQTLVWWSKTTERQRIGASRLRAVSCFKLREEMGRERRDGLVREMMVTLS